MIKGIRQSNMIICQKYFTDILIIHFFEKSNKNNQVKTNSWRNLKNKR